MTWLGAGSGENPSDLDQPLPWGDGTDLLGGPEAERLPEPRWAAADPDQAGVAGLDAPGPDDDRKTHCPTGHPYDDGNTYVNHKGWRSCRTCKRASDRRRRVRTAKNLTPEERVLRARLGAYRLHATHDPKETTKKAREAFAARFDRQVDPEGVLTPAERARRADAARRAYFTELQLRSSQARRRAG